MSRDPSLFLSPLDEPAGEPAGEPGGQEPVPEPSPVAGGRGRGRLGALVVVAALAVAAFGVNRLSASGDGADPGERASPPVGERRGAPTTRPDPRPTTTLPPSLATLEVRGLMLPEPTGTTLVLASSRRLLVVHLDSGTVRAAAVGGIEVYGGSPFHSVLPVGDGLLTSGPQPRLVDRRPGGPVREDLPSAPMGYLPSASDGRWWVVGDHVSPDLVEWDLDGETGGRIALPGDGGVALPLGNSFIVSPLGSVLQIDAGTGAVRRIGDGVAVAVDERTLARVRCDASIECGLVLSDLVGGRERTIEPPTPRSRYGTHSGVSFSPDGRWLVTPFFGEDQPGGLTLVDVERGERRFLDSLATSSRGGFPLNAAFTSDSRWLLLAEPTADGDPLRAIRIADGTSVELDLGLEVGDPSEGVVLLAIPSIPADADPMG